jgi:pathogenesis-related protein 1
MKAMLLLLFVVTGFSAANGQTQIKIPSSAPQAPAPQRAAVSLGSSLSAEDVRAALDFHNAKRKDVGAPPLTWSPELASIAQQWANRLAADKNCGLEHTPNSKYGENLFGGSGKAYTALDASQSWYDEIKDYTPGVLTESNWAKTGHYTQMVWSKTQRLGMGQATCPNGSTVIAAEYDPPGNYMGQKPY